MRRRRAKWAKWVIPAVAGLWAAGPALGAVGPASGLGTPAGVTLRPDATQWWLFAGKFHPLMVHFPIALLVCAVVVEFLRWRRGGAAGERGSARYSPGKTSVVCLALGAISAVAAAVMGWSGAETAGHSGTTAATLEWHRWLGVSTAGFAVFAAVFAGLARALPGPRLLSAYRLLIVTCALLVGVTGHYGASLIYGPTYIADAFDQLRPRGTGGPAIALASSGRKIDFVHEVQPILAKRCYACHAGETPEAGLNLTTREGALKGGKSGSAALVPGKSAQSKLVALILGQEPGKLMPPKGGALDEAQIATLRAWIDQGATWADATTAKEHWHWAYRPPVRPNPPAVKDTSWPRNTIDHFVLARLDAEGLAPSPEADKETLIRRVSLDLTGLPPTPGEIDAFLDDDSPTAYDKVVDRLLASPHYGERWARLWLDLARYADTNGYEKDNRRTIWPYRDWVINAFNRDLPFDRFTTEQLAGDLLPSPTLDQLVATGFNRNTMTNEEGGVDPEEFRVEAILDRVNTASSVWLGSTVACAQCHNHKYDPISQREYYQLFAFFNQDETDVKLHQFGADAAGAMVDVATPVELARVADLRARAADLNKQIEETAKTLGPVQEEWEREQARAQPKWTLLKAKSLISANHATLTAQPDGSVLASGEAPEMDTYTIETDTDLRGVTGLRLELLPDESGSIKLVGRSSHGNIVLSDIAVTAGAVEADGGPAPAAAAARPVRITAAVADHEQRGRPDDPKPWLIANAIDGDPKTGGWAIAPEANKPHAAIFQFDQPIAGSDAGTTLTITLAQNYGGKHTIGRFRLWATTDTGPAAATPLNPSLAAALAVPAAERSKEQTDQLAGHYRGIAPALIPLREALKSLNSQIAATNIPRTLVMKKQAEPRETHIQIKGSFLNPGEVVQAATPAVLHKPPAGMTADRLGLAHWIIDPANPLTARVTVNRYWEVFFGRGLVETSEDFGTQGELPSHPELLDWLATDFIRQGWSTKAIHRAIVTSATYRQSSRLTPQQRERDPDNRMLARGPRFRLEAETVRDVALAASGLLSGKIGGPSVFPPQPPGTWTMIYNSDQWVESTGEDRHRRGLYTFWRRTSPYPTFVNFDAPSREVACTRRPRTNTPLQALTTLNDPAFVEAAAALARRMVDEGGPDTAAKVTYGFRLCVARRPTEAELGRLVALYDQQLALYEQDETTATSVAELGPAGGGAEYHKSVVAAYTVVANVLLNLDETVTKG